MAKHASSTSKIVTLIVLVIFSLVFWHAAPFFLPRYRWSEVRFDEVAKQAATRGFVTTAAKLETQFAVEFCYAPRGAGDPRPWVLLKMTPAWHEFTANPDDDETGVLKRCAIISDRTGESITGFLLGSGQDKDKFFRAKAWRLPPGSLKFPEERPVIIFEAMTLEKFEIGESQVMSHAMRDPGQWQPDDDGYEPPAKVP